MRSSLIDFSAEFGGRDAAAAVLPHFKALKQAARGLLLDDFPFGSLDFILRVDGEVHQYGLLGPGNIDVDKNGEYLSVDIGISVEDRPQVDYVIAAAILSSIDLLRNLASTKPLTINFPSLRTRLLELIARYEQEVVALGIG